MKYNNLDELFNAWKEEQNNESNESCEKTFPKKYEKGTPIIPTEEFKESFCVDGFLSDKFNGVLFILKESNVDGTPELNGTFWFKGCLDGKISGKDANRWNLYRNSMEKYLEICRIGENIDYKQCAYMNLNKRGGYGKCNDEQLTNYVEEYKDYIKNQIKIFNPKHIICCGAGTVYDLVSKLIKNEMPEVKIYDCYHLCCSRRVLKRPIL